MARGRKRLPTKLKEVQGTLEKTRVLDDEMMPEPVSGVPMPPQWLSEVGKKEWHRVVEPLHAMKMVSGLDLGMLALYCNEMSVYIEMEQELRSKSRVYAVKDSEGNVKQIQTVAHQRIADRALEKALKIAVEFGFTPAARTKISMGQAAIIEKLDQDPRKKKFDI